MKRLFIIVLISLIALTSINSVDASIGDRVLLYQEEEYYEFNMTYGKYKVRQYYIEVIDEEFILDGTIRTFEDSCPTGWSFVPDPGGGGITPFSITIDDIEEIDIQHLEVYTYSTYIQCEKQGDGYLPIYSHEMFYYLGGSVTDYWSDDNLFVFTYQSNLLAPSVRMTIVNNDILLMERYTEESGYLFNFGIDRNTHYRRNEYNLQFPQNEIDFLSDYFNQYTCEEMIITGYLFNSIYIDKAYFHRTGVINEDTSNIHNTKYVCNNMPGNEYESVGSYEVIYDQYENIEKNPLVYGTFNFEDSANSVYGHYSKDVYPYLIWGNSYDDNSVLKERFIWDDDSSSPQLFNNEPGERLYEHRGIALFNQSGLTNSFENILNDLSYHIIINGG